MRLDCVFILGLQYITGSLGYYDNVVREYTITVNISERGSTLAEIVGSLADGVCPQCLESGDWTN